MMITKIKKKFEKWLTGVVNENIRQERMLYDRQVRANNAMTQVHDAEIAQLQKKVQQLEIQVSVHEHRLMLYKGVVNDLHTTLVENGTIPRQEVEEDGKQES